MISKHNPSHYTSVMECQMQTDVSIKLSRQIYKLLTRCHNWDPNLERYQTTKKYTHPLSTPQGFRSASFGSSNMLAVKPFAAYVMVLISRAYVRWFMRGKMAPRGVRSISAAQLKGVEWLCGAGGSHGAGRLTLRALFLLSC